MADKKKTLERAVEEAESFPPTGTRLRSGELMRGKIRDDQLDQYTDQNKAARAADSEDYRAATEIGGRNMRRRFNEPITTYQKGGTVMGRQPGSFAQGGPPLPRSGRNG